MRIANQDCLTKGWHVDRQTGCGVTPVNIEGVAAIENVASQQGVTTQLNVYPIDEVKIVSVGWQKTFNSPKLNACALSHAAHRDVNILRVQSHGIPR